MIRNNQGFTLLELLAILALITVVSAVSAPKIINTVNTAKEQKIISDMENIASALQRFCVEQELLTGNPKSCKLNGLGKNNGEWHGANNNIQSNIITEALKNYLDKEIAKHYTIIISVNENDWLNKKGYGSVSVWYPSLGENGESYHFSNIKVTNFPVQVYTKRQYANLSSNQKTIENSFILDLDGDGADNFNDFLVRIVHFKLNSTHLHSGNSQGIIQGTNEDNILHGTEYEDTMYGYAGDDTIYGYESNDQIYGGDDDDLIYGGLGNDIINGGDGIDTAVYSGLSQNYNITGNDPYTINGPDKSDTLINIEYLKFSDKEAEIDKFINNADCIYGTEGIDDPLWGTNDSDTIYALDGNDVIYAKDDDDYIYAGTGSDTITGGLGNDVINGNEGTDTAVYLFNLNQYSITGIGPYTITGPEGEDTLIDIEELRFADISGSIKDIVDGSSEIIHGTEYDDNQLMGTPNKDTIFAHGGNDIIYGLASNDTIDGGEGFDIAVFSSYFVYYDIEGYNPKVITGPDGADTLLNIEKLRFKDEDFYQENFEDVIDNKIKGTYYDDSLNGSLFKADIFMASKGQDIIRTRWGIDTIVFNDVINNYTIKEGKGFKWSSVSDNEGNITYFKTLFKTKLQFTDTVFYSD
ncbi:calcium-binding protein [Clostridium sp. 'deep sea']|uniref:calcium-binding protein n=1 Tax=Clostridium sp. 'deep sea' TaxID=2779445 RepID=UPI001896669F|nr:calcium-binding protein [Clostridium sp. 'deep sea']QOR34066.1 calcium-binding protein [Clostridium sp. 'deep sea']